MKRFLSALLCAMLLLGLLPAMAPAARMYTVLTVTANKETAFVGDSVTWSFSEDLPGTYDVTYTLFKRDSENQSYYDFVSSFQGVNIKSHTFVLAETGAFFVDVAIGNPFVPDRFGRSENTAVTFRPAPKDVKVEAVSGTALKLTWGKVPGATGYEIWRRIGSIGEYKRFTTTTALCFSNTYLTAGTRYYYQIRAYNLIGGVRVPSSGLSTARAGVPLAKSVITSAVGVSTSQIKLNWTKVSGATGYQMFMCATSGGTYKLIKTTTALSYTAGGLKPGTNYYFKVRPYKKIYTAIYYGPLSAYKAGKTK